MPSSEVMHKWGQGKLHSGSKTGPEVKSQKQALAIMFSERRAEAKHGGKYPEKAFGGSMMGSGIAGPMGPMGATPGGMMPRPQMPMNSNVMQPPSGISGGMVPGTMPTSPRQLAPGGVAMPGVGNFNMAKQANVNPNPIARSEERSVMHGPVMSSVPGRTDAHKTAVPSGSYVLPSDIISARGQGNTLAGMNIFQKMFKMGPYGSPGGNIRPGRSMPGAMKPPKMQPVMGSSGGGKKSGQIGKPTPVHLAGGELVIPPNKLMEVVHPDLDTAHKIMDKFVVNERKRLINTLKKLPPPVRD